MQDISEEVLLYWEYIVTKVGEKLDIDYDVIDIFKTNKEFKTYILLAVNQYIPSLEYLIIIAILTCGDYIGMGKIGKLNLIWFCYDIRDELVKKLISLDEERYSYIKDIKEENYNDLTDITNILELFYEKNIYRTYRMKKLKYLKNVLTN